VRTLSLCSGYGGLDLALEYVIGDTELVGYAEFDKDAASVMAHHWPDVPNYKDLTLIDWHELVELEVDIITAGYPCQPFSLAGRRKGTNDARHLWPYIAEAVRVLRPRYVFLENVPGHRSKGFGDVLGELAEAGYDAGWTSVRASEVGAPHIRERVFILATDSRRLDGDEGRGPASGPEEGRRTLGLPDRRDHGQVVPDTDSEQVRDPEVADRRGDSPPLVGGDGQDAADSEGVGREAGSLSLGAEAARSVPASDSPDPASVGPSFADAYSYGRARWQKRDSQAFTGEGQPQLGMDADGRYVEWGDYKPAIVRWGSILGRDAPFPVAIGPRGGRRVSTEFVEWMMGLPAGWISGVPGMKLSTGVKLGGNGVVPLQGATAFAQLAIAML
jgi:DNA (cytosine-5)-methyltransferase 1